MVSLVRLAGCFTGRCPGDRKYPFLLFLLLNHLERRIHTSWHSAGVRLQLATSMVTLLIFNLPAAQVALRGWSSELQHPQILA